MKKTILLAILLCISSAIFADNYIIRDVEYDVKGITRPYAIETKVLVDKKLVFKNEDELMD